jgi:hypothetical protein
MTSAMYSVKYRSSGACRYASLKVSTASFRSAKVRHRRRHGLAVAGDEELLQRGLAGREISDPGVAQGPQQRRDRSLLPHLDHEVGTHDPLGEPGKFSTSVVCIS